MGHVYDCGSCFVGSGLCGPSSSLNLQAFCIMAKFEVENLMCLNGVVVPKVTATMAVCDPYNLAGNLQLDVEKKLEVDLVSFKVTADTLWLCKACGFHKKWWIQNSSKLPLLQEIKDLIKHNKPQKGQTLQRLPRYPDSLVPLRVRGKVLLVQNCQIHLNLALSGSWVDKAATLTWFMEELDKDLQNHPQEAKLDGELVPKKTRVAPLPPTWQDLVASTLKTLKEQPAVTGVWWLPSKRVFRFFRRTRRNLWSLLSRTSGPKSRIMRKPDLLIALLMLQR